MEGGDERYRSLTVATAIRDAIRKRLTARTSTARRARRGACAAKRRQRRSAAASTRASAKQTILNELDMSQRADAKTSRSSSRAAGPTQPAAAKAQRRGVSTILVFEGWDAAGKGGAIRRRDRRARRAGYQVIPIAAPTDEERAQHYLWRFWRHLPARPLDDLRSQLVRSRAGRACRRLRDRSRWMRARRDQPVREQLVAHGIVLVKFWLHITKEEQLRRFRARGTVAYKRWKLTDEDWRNRKRWADYELAVNDMVARTSTRARAVDARRGQRQELRAAEGAGDRVRPAGRPRGVMVGRMFYRRARSSREQKQFVLNSCPPVRILPTRLLHVQCPASDRLNGLVSNPVNGVGYLVTDFEAHPDLRHARERELAAAEDAISHSVLRGHVEARRGDAQCLMAVAHRQSDVRMEPDVVAQRIDRRVEHAPLDPRRGDTNPC